MNEKIYEYRKSIMIIAIAVICVILSHINIRFRTIDPAYVTLILCAIPIIYESIKSLIRKHDIKADVLVSIASIASVFIGEIFAAAEIAVIMQIGALLEEITVSTTKFRIEKLIKLQPRKARILQNNIEK